MAAHARGRRAAATAFDLAGPTWRSRALPPLLAAGQRTRGGGPGRAAQTKRCRMGLMKMHRSQGRRPRCVGWGGGMGRRSRLGHGGAGVLPPKSCGARRRAPRSLRLLAPRRHEDAASLQKKPKQADDGDPLAAIMDPGGQADSNAAQASVVANFIESRIEIQIPRQLIPIN